MGENKTCFQLTRQLTKREGTDKSDSSQQEALPGAGTPAYGKYEYALVGLECCYTHGSFTASLRLSVAIPNPIFLAPKSPFCCHGAVPCPPKLCHVVSLAPFSTGHAVAGSGSGSGGGGGLWRSKYQCRKFQGE